MNDRHTYQPSKPTQERTPTRTERRFQEKFRKRSLKKAHRKALHGMPRLESPPSLLQSLRLAMEMQRKQAEIEKLLALPAAALTESGHPTATELQQAS